MGTLHVQTLEKVVDMIERSGRIILSDKSMLVVGGDHFKSSSISINKHKRENRISVHQ